MCMTAAHIRDCHSRKCALFQSSRRSPRAHAVRTRIATAAHDTHPNGLVARRLCAAAAAAALACSSVVLERPVLATEVQCSLPQLGSVRPWTVLAGLLDFGRPAADDGPPAAPFNVTGLTSKKYIIEQTQGEKIVSRKQGITTVTCISTRPASSDKSFPAEQFKTCVKAEARQVAPACASSCQSACSSGIAEFNKFSRSFSGFESAAEDVDKVVRACTRRCTYECKKPGDGYEFGVRSRQ